jgi:hypothetical protein
MPSMLGEERRNTYTIKKFGNEEVEGKTSE